jgi:hypothetical protein
MVLSEIPTKLFDVLNNLDRAHLAGIDVKTIRAFVDHVTGAGRDKLYDDILASVDDLDSLTTHFRYAFLLLCKSSSSSGLDH